jgi:hypothetical protein
VQQFQPLRYQLRVQRRHAREVAARAVQAGNEAKLDRVDPGIEHDRNRRGRRPGRKCRKKSSRRGNHDHLATNQVGREFRQAFVVAFRPSILDQHIEALDIAGFA